MFPLARRFSVSNYLRAATSRPYKGPYEAIAFAPSKAIGAIFVILSARAARAGEESVSIMTTSDYHFFNLQDPSLRSG